VKVRYRQRALADIDGIFQYLNERSASHGEEAVGVMRRR
jgi:plasmid stabilization system protein ParE